MLLVQFVEQLGQLSLEDPVGACPSRRGRENRDGLEVVALDGEVRDQVLADVLDPLGLLVGERLRPATTRSTAWLTRSSAVSSGEVERGALDHRDDVDERLVVGGLEGLLQVGLGEVLGCLVSASRSSVSGSAPHSFGRTAGSRWPRSCLACSSHELGEGLPGTRSGLYSWPLPPRMSHSDSTSSSTPGATMNVRSAAGSRRGGPGSRGRGGASSCREVVARSLPGSSSAKPARSPSGMKPGEQLAAVAGHLLVDALEPLDQAADVVVAVLVLPDLLDDLRDVLPSPSGGSTVMPVVLRKYSSSVPSKQSKTVKCDLSGYFSPLRVPRPSICSNRMRDFTGRRKTMNSRSGMSTPVVSRSTVTTMPGFGRLRNSRMRCSGRSTRPVILATNASPGRRRRGQVDELVGVRGVRQVVGREDQRLREAAVTRARARRRRP